MRRKIPLLMLKDMMLAESMIKYIINYVLENAPEEMEFFKKHLRYNRL